MDYLLHSSNQDPLRLILAMKRQWRTESVSGMQKFRIIFQGLDYGVLEAVERKLGISLSPDQFTRFQAAEGALLKLMNAS